MTTPAIDPAPTTAPQAPSAPDIADAIAAARARLAGGEPLVPDELAPLPHPAVTQARDEQGQFAAPDVRETEPDAGEPIPPMTPPPPVGADEGEAPAGEPVDETAPAPTVIALPGRRDGDPDLEIEVSDPEVAEALQRQRNGYQRGEQLKQERAAIEKDKAERADFVALIEQDPVAFVTKYIQPELQAETAMYLLTQPAVWERVQAHLDTMLQDPSALEVTRSQLEVARYQARDRIAQSRVEREQSTANVQRVVEAVHTLVPQGLTPDQAEVFHRDCLGDLSHYARVNHLNNLTEFQIMDALSSRLRAYRINPFTAAASFADPGAPSSNGRSSPSPATPPRPSAPAPAAQAAVPGRRDALKAIARRVNAAAVPAPGQATPSAASATPTKGSRIEDVIAEARRRIAAGGPLVP